MKIWKTYLYFVIFLNLNSLFFGFTDSYYDNKEFMAWSLSHYLTFFIALFLFSEVNARNKFKSKTGKRILYGSIILSLAAVFNGWYLGTTEFFSLVFVLLTVIQLLAGAANIILIIKCKKFINEVNENTKQRMEFKKEVAEVANFLENNMYDKSRQKDIIYSAALSTFTLIFIIILYIIIPPVLRHNDNRDYIIYLSLPFIIALVIVNKLKNERYYIDLNKALKVSIIDSILIMGGLAFYYYFEGVVYYKTGEYNFIVMIIPVFMLLTLLNTNYKISKEYYRFLNNKNEKK